MRQFVTSNDGTKIAYEKAGYGQIVIQVLGALNSRKTGAKLAKTLAPKFTIISYDRRGRGDSTNNAPYSPEREVEDLEALIGAAGEPVYLYGHSSGGSLVLKTAIKVPKQVKKIAIYEVPYSVEEASRKAATEYYKQLNRLLKAGLNGEAVALFVKSVGVSDKQIQAMKKMSMWRGLERLAPTLAYDSEVLGDGHSLPTSLLSHITTPTLVMHGGAGAPSMRDAARAISEAIPKARLRTLDCETHGVRPKNLAPVLEEFFR